MKKETIRISIDLPQDLHRRLHERAARVGCSARRLILESIQSAVEEPRPVRHKQRLSLETPIVPSRGKPFDLSGEPIDDLLDLPFEGQRAGGGEPAGSGDSNSQRPARSKHDGS